MRANRRADEPRVAVRVHVPRSRRGSVRARTTRHRGRVRRRRKRRRRAPRIDAFVSADVGHRGGAPIGHTRAARGRRPRGGAKDAPRRRGSVRDGPSRRRSSRGERVRSRAGVTAVGRTRVALGGVRPGRVAARQHAQEETRRDARRVRRAIEVPSVHGDGPRRRARRTPRRDARRDCYSKRRRRRAHALGGWGETHARNFGTRRRAVSMRRVGMAFDGGRASAARGSLGGRRPFDVGVFVRGGVGRHARPRKHGPPAIPGQIEVIPEWEEMRRIAHGGVVEVHPASREDAFRSKATWDDERDAQLAAEAANTRSLWESTADGEWERSRTTVHAGVVAVRDLLGRDPSPSPTPSESSESSEPEPEAPKQPSSETSPEESTRESADSRVPARRRRRNAGSCTRRSCTWAFESERKTFRDGFERPL